MQKSKGLKIALYCLFPVVFNLFFFLLSDGGHPASVWIAYAFIHLAWVLLIATPLLAPSGPSKGFLNLSVYSISLIFFLAELLIGLVIIVMHPQTIKATILIQALLLAVYAAILIPVLITNEHSERKMEQRQRGAEDIRELCTQVKALFNVIPDEKLNRELQRTYNALHAAPAAGNLYYDEISAQLRELKSAVYENDRERAVLTCKRIQDTIA